MSEEVIDIIHRFSYEINDQELRSATGQISRQITEVQRLEGEIRDLSREFARTAATETAKREEIIRKINVSRQALRSLNNEIEENIINNRELQNVLQREQGVINNLNTQLALLERRRAAATDPASIQRYSQQIAAIQAQRGNALSLNGPAGTANFNTTGANMALSNIVRDAPFGIIGVQNNITQLSDAFAQLQRQTGSTAIALRALAGSFIGAGGISFGISAITSLLTVLVQKYGSLSNAVHEIFGNLSELEKAQRAYNSVIEDAAKSAGKEIAALSALQAKYNDTYTTQAERVKLAKEYNKTADDANKIAVTEINNLDRVNQLITQQISLIEKRALARAAENKLAEAASKYFEVVAKNQGVIDAGQLLGYDGNNITDVAKKAADAAEAVKAAGLDIAKLTNTKIPQKGSSKIDIKNLLGLPTPEETDEAKKESNQLKAAVMLSGDQLDKVVQDRNKKLKNLGLNPNYQTIVIGYNQAVSAVAEAKKTFDEKVQQYLPFFDIDGLISKSNTKDKQSPENVYEQRLQALKARLASITESAFQSDDTIKAKITEAIQKDQLEIDKAFKESKLTGPQRDTLTALLGTIKKAEIEKALGDFNKVRMEAQRKIDDELNSLIIDDAKHRADLILDDFDKQSAKLSIEYQAQVTALQKAKEALLKENAENTNKGLIDEDAALKNIDNIERYYAKLLTDIGLLFQQNKNKLSLSLFDQALSFYKTGFSKQSAIEAERMEAEVKKLSDSYIKGGISYKKYQQSLTQVLRDQTSARRQLNLNELQDELDLQQRKLDAAKGVLSDKEIDAIERRIADLRKQIANLKQEADTANAENKKANDDLDKKRRDEKIAGYKAIVDAAAEAARQIVQIQQDQVEREINIQEQRVNRAQAIADRGNAKALQTEEQRLSKLQKEREKYARQQIAINAIQTVSSSVLAIAQAAGETGAGAIVIVPAVIAALAAGFAAVKAMTADAGSFRDGVVGLQGPGTTTSDSIPANLSRGESVITADGTAKHKELLEGINAGKRYKVIGDRILEMSQGNSLAVLQSTPLKGMVVINNAGGQSDKKMLKRLEAIEQAVLSKPNTSVVLDRRGFAAMVVDHIQYNDKLKKL